LAARGVPFRNRLRENDENRSRYAAVKRELASWYWTHVKDYAGAKTDIVMELIKKTETAPG
jgi:GrpB-like predicted nucleotidyltransferase (UPF0157 family)